MWLTSLEAEGSAMETFELSSSQWTVGQLRAELVGLPDSMPIVVFVAERPGGEITIRQVLTGAGFGVGIRIDDVPARDAFPLSADYPTGTYPR